MDNEQFFFEALAAGASGHVPKPAKVITGREEQIPSLIEP